jgi:hypothetical protein
MAVRSGSQRTQKRQIKDLPRMLNTKNNSNKTLTEMGRVERR